jgi:hypothetical protein
VVGLDLAERLPAIADDERSDGRGAASRIET